MSADPLNLFLIYFTLLYSFYFSSALLYLFWCVLPMGQRSLGVSLLWGRSPVVLSPSASSLPHVGHSWVTLVWSASSQKWIFSSFFFHLSPQASLHLSTCKSLHVHPLLTAATLPYIFEQRYPVLQQPAVWAHGLFLWF